MPPRTQGSIDSELLQADVMRFMAIIAFCLIAILALVRNVDAPPVDAEPTPPAVVAAPEPELKPEPEKKTERVVAAAPPPVAPPTPAIAPRPVPKPKPELERLIASPKPIASPTPSPTPAPAIQQPIAPAAPPEEPQPLPIEQLAAAPEPEPEPEPPQEKGLSLRFESDKDFLRLISKRDIAVYLFNDQDAQRLSNRYDFASAAPPRQLYEVLAATIPDAITRAARRDLGNYDRYRWGIAIPRPIEQQISGFVAAAASGELVIDRYGRVHHVE